MLPPNLSYPNLRILNVANPDDAKRLLLLLSDEYELNRPEELDDLYLLQKTVSDYSPPSTLIHNLVTTSGYLEASVRTVVVEFDYIDRDTNVAYVQLHARAFREYPRRAVRLHFFSKEVTYNHFLDEHALQSSYLGFCVLSPVKPRTIGRAVISARRDDAIRCFVPTFTEFSVNLGGARLLARGAAFVQQDGRVAACASAAIWVSTSILAKHWNDSPSRSTTEITQIATKYSLPPLGSGASPGLSMEQILWALHEMGYEPITYTSFDFYTAKEIIYNYLESGIPPILGVFLPSQRGAHAVTVVGHTYNPDIDQKEVQAQRTENIQSTNVLYPDFLIHDDQIGPYLKLRITPPNSTSRQRPVLSLRESDELLRYIRNDVYDWYENAALLFIIAPLPLRHSLRPEVATERAKALLSEVYDLYRSRFNLTFPSSPAYRTYFIPSNDYKRHFSLRTPGLSPDVADWYRGSLFSRYIWVTELYNLDQHVHSPKDLRVIADVTIDATSSPLSLSEDFITLHIPHLFFRMFPQDTSVAEALQRPSVVFSNDTPYQPFLRY